MAIEVLEDLITKKGVGAERLREFYDLPLLLKDCFNTGAQAPDESLEKPEDLIEIANKIPSEFQDLHHLYPADTQKVNRTRRVRFFNKQSEIASFFTKYVSGCYEEFLENNQHEIAQAKSNISVLNEFKALERIFTTVDQTLFQHIDPISSPARKLEAIRVYELAKELRKIAEFFFEQKGLFFSLRDLGHFVIPFTISFSKRVAGIINHDGRICFHPSQNIFFNGLKIQKLHRCAACQKFLLIASGKDNVDRTCSKSCRKILKNQKQNEKYASNLILVSENRKYRKIQKRSEKAEFRFDEYTEKSFLTKLNGDNAATAFYVAWTETFAALNGEVRRKDREKLHTISTKYEKVILDHGVLERYRPGLINTRTKFTTDLCSPTEIIVPELVLIYFIRLSRNMELKKMEQFWRRTGYLDLKRQYYKTDANLENKKLILDRFLDLVEKVEGKIENNGFMLPLNKSREHNSYLARCDVLATALVEKLPVVTCDARFYTGLLPKESDVKFIHAKDFFGAIHDST